MLSAVGEMVSEEWNEPASTPTWAQRDPGGGGEHWRAVDSALRSIAQRRAALDAEEARWLREAEALQIWRPLGMVNALDYMERVLGYAPRAAQDRLRVARALGDLPALTAALAEGALPFSAVRELTRIATPTTEAAWRDAAAGQNLRQIEALVAGHRPGDLPDDPSDPDVRTHVVRFELSPETFAVLRQARGILDDEHGANLSDDAFIATIANGVIGGANFDSSERSGQAKFQVALTVCERCKAGWQLGGGAMIPVGPAAVARAECDAQHLGSLDAVTPARAYQDISPAVARFVWRRDEGRCQTPGCRSSRGLEIHHIVHRADGGGHEATNLRIHCSSCHQAQHAGTLKLAGSHERLTVERIAALQGANPSPSPSSDFVGVRASPCAADAAEEQALTAGARGALQGASPLPARKTKLDAAIIRTQAKDALVRLGWKPGVARAAVDTAMIDLHGAGLEAVIVAALRCCPRPSSREQ